jgi:hypothetical protein
MEADLESVQRIIDDEQVEVTDNRELTKFEKNFLFPLCDVDDAAMRLIRVHTTKRKYNRIVKRTSGRKIH